MHNELIANASLKKMICLTYVCRCGDCVVCTDSGGRQRYIAGRLDNGDLFVEKLDLNYLNKYCDSDALKQMGL